MFKCEDKKMVPSVYNKGYFGVGKYVSKVNGKHTKNYSTWRSMVQRCYSDKHGGITYEGCEVCEEWLNFQTYSEWFDETYPVGCKVQLDKDVLGDGKIYSPETCCWLPSNLNSLLTDRGNDRGDCPMGVFYDKVKGCFSAQISLEGRSNGSYLLGSSSCPYEAFSFYKEAKEKRIKSRATEYKDVISERALTALLEYKILDDSPWQAHLHLEETT